MQKLKSGWVTLGIVLALGILPPVFLWSGQAFYMDLATRLIILAIAAVSLNLILGFGGLVSFGHAAFIGIGAYCVGIPTYHATYGEFGAIATYSGLFQILLAVTAAALFALITGMICLRTKGVYFIMITMAFAQMVFYLFVSLEAYGGDDGLVIDTRSEFPLINLDDPLQMYLFSYASLVAALLIVRTIIRSRFGAVLRGAKDNNERVVTLGYNTYLYRLTAYVISGAICGYAGALLGNFTTFISPEMMDWTRSGELMFMVILGGAGTTLGPVLGSLIFILVEEVLSHFTIYWHLPFGIMLIAIVLFVRGGLMGLVSGNAN
ncbi:MAG: branched-chain amino acid ABC transporter permease [Hyphomicrobiales bacterium]|nr:branched-chain amino acid ABC transporter permease [Hyphomicrobiales bacterium]MCP4998321.1 branched-chain amino acid ABC transporter permease [Hyphomicrobiales bacterium]